MKKATALFLALSVVSVPVLAQTVTTQSKPMRTERHQQYVIPSNSAPVSKIAQGVEKQGYQVYSIHPERQSGYYRVVAAKGTDAKVKQYYDMKTAQLVPNTDPVYQKKHERKQGGKHSHQKSNANHITNQK